ncbi:MAG TPA: hypothetical protein VM925_35020 [Labilithrix sp.]|nr:hypothetical protein [Labilithrix sp.]
MSERWSDEHVHRVVEELDHDEVGMGMWEVHKRFAFVVNDVTRNVSVIDFNTQAVAGEKPENAIVVRAATLPAENSTEDKVRKGKRFFNTATGRWSLKGQGWNGCQSCHMDGLSDNVTWFFARGPRQSTSLDGRTISRKFYDASAATNDALNTTAWAPPAGFPTALLPAADQRFRRSRRTCSPRPTPTNAPQRSMRSCNTSCRSTVTRRRSRAPRRPARRAATSARLRIETQHR